MIKPKNSSIFSYCAHNSIAIHYCVETNTIGQFEFLSAEEVDMM